jgi:hypothetical protein
MTWIIDIGVSYVNSDHGQAVLERTRETLLDIFTMAGIGADAIFDDLILANLSLNIIKINQILEPCGVKLYGVEKYGELEFRLDFIDPLLNTHINPVLKEKSYDEARQALLKAGYTLNLIHYRNE